MKQSTLIAWGGATALLLWLTAKGGSKFHKLVKNQTVRPDDAYGGGEFHDSRNDGSRLHNGLDIKTIPGEAIFSPVDGIIKRYSYPYGPSAGLAGYHIKTDKYLIKIWYLAPNQKEGMPIKKGQIIGFAQSLQGRYPGITDHVHIEVWDLTKNNVAIDPATLF